jgi:hypothetical protein
MIRRGRLAMLEDSRLWMRRAAVSLSLPIMIQP